MTSLKSAARSLAPRSIWKRLIACRSRVTATSNSVAGYNRTDVRAAWRAGNGNNARVLVVGAGHGEDCRGFVKLGAQEVHGLDIVEDVGSAFKHERVFYHRGTIEACGYPAGYFDLVFARATMEHVADLRAGFSEMARVTKPGGTIWSNASPLWHSPYGHHMECFQGHPWIHLVFDQGAIISYARAHGIDGERGHSLEAIVDYMLDRRFFNMLPARAYIDAVRALQGVSLVRNELVRLDAELLNQPLAGRALEIGLDRDELLSVTHQMIARKI